MEYKKVPTSAEVWAVIRAKHQDMVVFGSYSAPCGDYGDSTKGRMETSYGFDGSDFPVIEARTTWDIDPESLYKRKNEKHEYWLCIPKKEQQ